MFSLNGILWAWKWTDSTFACQGTPSRYLNFYASSWSFIYMYITLYLYRMLRYFKKTIQTKYTYSRYYSVEYTVIGWFKGRLEEPDWLFSASDFKFFHRHPITSHWNDGNRRRYPVSTIWRQDMWIELKFHQSPWQWKLSPQNRLLLICLLPKLPQSNFMVHPIGCFQRPDFFSASSNCEGAM